MASNERSGNQGGSQGEQGSMTVQEAGRKGGEAVVEKYGPEHMAEIGRKGGEARADDEDVRSGELGRKGGEAVSKDREHMAEIGRKGGENSHGGHSDDDDSGNSGGNRGGGQNSGQRDGSSEQHAKAGSQSHKND